MSKDKNIPEVEEWKDIEKFNGSHQISNLGRIRSVDRVDTLGRNLRGKILKTNYDPGGYDFLTIQKDSGKSAIRIHRELARAFLPDFAEELEVDHINRNTKDNRLSNLRMVKRGFNQHNTRPVGKTSIYKGVAKQGNRWASSLSKDGKRHESYFSKEIEAALNYDRLAIALYGDDACTNKSLGLL